MGENNNLIKIVIPKFSEYIRISEARRAKPILKTSKKPLPKKYQTEDYTWNKKGQLINAKTGSLIASNSITVGKPRDWRINGQDIYNQKIKHTTRGGIMQKMHQKFNQYLKDIVPLEQFPITVHIKFYILDANKQANRENNIDNDNRWIYHKVIQDCLTDLKKIPDDSPYYINENRHKTYFVEDEKDVRLEINLYTDD